MFDVGVFLTVVVVGIAGAGFFNVRSSEDRADQRPRSPGPRNAARSLARWAIVYCDADGVLTSRIVQVLRVAVRKQQLICWCELRNEERTFSISGIRKALDTVDDGLVNLPEWLSIQRASRKEQRLKSKGSGS